MGVSLDYYEIAMGSATDRRSTGETRVPRMRDATTPPNHLAHSASIHSFFRRSPSSLCRRSRRSRRCCSKFFIRLLLSPSSRRLALRCAPLRGYIIARYQGSALAAINSVCVFGCRRLNHCRNKRKEQSLVTMTLSEEV